MSITDTFASIENHRTSALANVGSNLNVVLRQAWQVKDIPRLARRMRRLVVASRVASRVLTLSSQEPDIRFENPNDIPLLIYQWLLVQAGSPLARLASVAVSKGRNLWWASRYARLYLQGRLDLNDSTRQIDLRPTRNKDAGESLVTVAFASEPRPLVVPNRLVTPPGILTRYLVTPGPAVPRAASSTSRATVATVTR